MDDGAHRSQGQEKPPRSLRQVALIVTGISGGIALAASLVTWIVEEIDYTHPLGNVGWLAFPAGFVAVGGLVTLLGDALLSATTPSREQETINPQRAGTSRSVGGRKPAMMGYAIYLLIGALGVIAMTIYLRAWGAVYQGLLLFLCAVAFSWNVWQPLGRSAESLGPSALTGNEPDRSTFSGTERRSLRQWGLAFTGGGAGLAVAMFLFSMFAVYVQDTGPPYGLLLFLGFGYLVAAGGLAVLLVDGVLRLTGRRY